MNEPSPFEEELRVCSGEDHGYCCPEGIYVEQPDGYAVHRDDVARYRELAAGHQVPVKYPGPAVSTPPDTDPDKITEGEA